MIWVKEELFVRLEEIYADLVAIRREMHMYPELSHKEKNTPEKIAEYLTALGLEVKTGVGGRGVVGILEGSRPGKTIALRADFDALPIQDKKDVDYKSQIPGVMHACGHDIHTAALLGVAKVLSENRHSIEGTIVFIHQFAEEVIPGGAKFMIEDGCMDEVDVVYGAHVSSTSPLGFVGVREGDFMANGDTFEIEISGKGGHAAMPHLTVDPLIVGGQLIVNLQQIVSRQTDPLKSSVVSVTSFNGGEGFNVIPDKVTIKGTVRTFDPNIRDMVEESIRRITISTCNTFGASAECNYVRGYPAVVTDAKETNRVKNVAVQLYGNENVKRIKPRMGMEDFAYYLKEAPGTFFFVGGALENQEDVFPHHHPEFDVNEKSILNIGKLFIATVFNYLEENNLPPE